MATGSWISRLFFGSGGGAAPLAIASGSAHVQTGIVGPWTNSEHLAHIAFSELFVGATDIVDRKAAMRVAPVKRGRAIIVGSCADLPLQDGSWTDGVWTSTKDAPLWLNRTQNVQSTWHRMAWTIDDLLFYGWSLWALNRTENGTIVDALRIPHGRWEFDPDGVEEETSIGIKVDGKGVTDARSIILFQGPDEGLLDAAADVIRGARAMEAAWVGRVQNPIPMTVLQETERDGVTETEAKEYVETWSKARTSPTGAVGFLPSTLEMHVFGDTVADLFTEGRNNVRLDVANHMNLPASALDGSTATASLTYVTQEGDRTALVDWLEYWLAPIEARLSMDDITPRGRVVRFDRSNLTDAPNNSHGPAQDAPDTLTATAAPAAPTPAIEA